MSLKDVASCPGEAIPAITGFCSPSHEAAAEKAACVSDNICESREIILSFAVQKRKSTDGKVWSRVRGSLKSIEFGEHHMSAQAVQLTTAPDILMRV